MKLSFKSKTKETVLFVCVENAGRSQMAEAFFRKYSPDNYEAISAGTHHTSQINPLVVQVMEEVGLDIGNQKPKEMTEDMIKKATIIINMGCMDKNFCPTLFINRIIDWNIEDPKNKPIEKVREIRNVIEDRVKEIVQEIGKEDKD
ncbi:MAG: arsenate reductase ArsC [Thermoproteota archaeon]|nr:arsenate reductase ArsC [Thermoproteota archaeon]